MKMRTVWFYVVAGCLFLANAALAQQAPHLMNVLKIVDTIQAPTDSSGPRKEKPKAAVTIQRPPKVAPGQWYYEVFTETNGVAVVFKDYNYILITPDGTRFTRSSSGLAESAWIKVPAGGKVMVHSRVPASWENGTRVIDGWYSGLDDNGKYISVRFSYEVSDK